MVLSLVNLQEVFYQATLTASGLAEQFVRHTYAPDSQPGWEQAENLIFLNVSPQDDPYDKLRDIAYAEGDITTTEERVFYTRVIAVDWTLYGPLSYDLADLIRHGILIPPIREILAKKEIYPLTSIDAPRRGPYEFNMQWWERTDLRALFNVGTRRTATVPLLAGATVEIETGTLGPSGVGDSRIITIQE